MLPETMLNVILDLTKDNNIKITKWNKKCHGKAHENREIHIPKPIDYETFGYCFHEIYHIIGGHFKHNKPEYIEEYEADQYAITMLKKYSMYKKAYEMTSICFICSIIAKHKNKGMDLREVPEKILRWAFINVNKWNKSKKVSVNFKICKTKKDINKNIKFL